MEYPRKAVVHSQDWADPDAALNKIVQANATMQEAESVVTGEKSWLRGWLSENSSGAPAVVADGTGNAPDDVTGHTTAPAAPAGTPARRKNSKKAKSR